MIQKCLSWSNRELWLTREIIYKIVPRWSDGFGCSGRGEHTVIYRYTVPSSWLSPPFQVQQEKWSWRFSFGRVSLTDFFLFKFKYGIWIMFLPSVSLYSKTMCVQRGNHTLNNYSETKLSSPFRGLLQWVLSSRLLRHTVLRPFFLSYVACT